MIKIKKNIVYSRPHCICVMVLTAITMQDAKGRDYFNPALLEVLSTDQERIDLTTFSQAGGQLPGTYRVDIWLNNEKKTTRDVIFQQVPDANGNARLLPCISVAELAEWGVMTNRYPELGAPDSTCANISALPQATSEFKFDRQQLLLSLPQSAIKNTARGWVDPKYWDDGIPAFLLNYSLSAANSRARGSDGTNSNSEYVNLRPGLNLGPWRLRNYTVWSRNSTDGQNGQTNSKWDTVYTYLQRDIKALGSQLILGDSTSASDVFDSIPYRGLQLLSDDDMLPESLRGYAPVVRGIARTNAKVTIRQNGYVIYETYVSPGSFEINDMYPTGGSGDLDVTIQEADGSEQKILIPFASLPVLQREGRFKYNLTSGTYRSYDRDVKETPLTVLTAIYGLPKGITLYGGSQLSSKYQSVALGVGKNLGELGALSIDITQASSEQKNRDREKGQSWRLRYSKNIVETGTNFAIAGYRYATSGYWGMQEVLDTYRNSRVYPLQERRRNRAELTMSQNLSGQLGNIGLSAIREDYWNSNRRMESAGASYSNIWQGVSYSLNFTRTRNTIVTSGSNGGARRFYDEDNQFSLNLSVPFSLFDAKRSTYATLSTNTSKNGNTSNILGVGGTALADNSLNWSVQSGYGSQGQGYSGGLNADWRATYGQTNAGYAYDSFGQRLNYGVQGGILVHKNGITFGQPMGETPVLVEVPGAKGISVNSGVGIRTDYRGYAIVPYASPYRKNELSLNSDTFNNETDVDITTLTIVPTRGAVVKARYNASIGLRALITLKRDNGKPVPFGATVNIVGQPERDFIVSTEGEVYLTGLEQEGKLLVRWGANDANQCQASFNLPDDANNNGGIRTLTLLCH